MKISAVSRSASLLSLAAALPVDASSARVTTIATGDTSGADIGVYAYAEIQWYAADTFRYRIYVSDTRADASETYAWLRVYGDGKAWDLRWAGSPSNSAVINHNGKGGEPEMIEKVYQSPAVPGNPNEHVTLTGVRVKACVNDAFGDTCTDNTHGDFVTNDFA